VYANCEITWASMLSFFEGIFMAGSNDPQLHRMSRAGNQK